uniref:(northern house mosquito) hypothetical protein n=1 Tax=Culex pipiens TaxID=7175 RepID=A0A8D7ZWA0_CULPI
MSTIAKSPPTSPRIPALQLRMLHIVRPVVLYRHRLQRVQERIVIQTVHLVRIVPDRAIIDVPARVRLAQRLRLVQIQIPPVQNDQRSRKPRQQPQRRQTDARDSAHIQPARTLTARAPPVVVVLQRVVLIVDALLQVLRAERNRLRDVTARVRLTSSGTHKVPKVGRQNLADPAVAAAGTITMAVVGQFPPVTAATC